jgi:hypothetical protein
VRWLRAAAVWIGALAAACSYYDASLLLSPAAPADGGGDSSTQLCPHASPPDKPKVTNAGGELDLVFAIRHLSFGFSAPDGPSSIGYDIDRTCTCQGEHQSCLLPSWAPGEHCDGPEGRDNATGAFFQELNKVAPSFGEDAWNKDLERGRSTVLIRVQSYNGLADDDQVEMSWYMAAKFWATNENPDGGVAAPRWDGTDAWPVRDVSLVPQPEADGGVSYDVDRPLQRDTKAYVSGGVLVGMIPQGMVQVDPSMIMVFTDPFLTAKLVDKGGSWELQDGLVAGVWRLDDIFAQLGFLAIASVPMCVGSPFYGSLKEKICRNADIYHARGTPTTPCDGLSIGMSFSGEAARLGEVLVVGGDPKLCPPTTDPANDSCDK